MHVLCDYCGQKAVLQSGKHIYPSRPDLWGKKFYVCDPCEAWVGCHSGKRNAPLGRLAKADLRKAKMVAHAALDPHWKSGRMSRSAAYARLAKDLGLPESKCHIGTFDVQTCEAVVAVCGGWYGR